MRSMESTFRIRPTAAWSLSSLVTLFVSLSSFGCNEALTTRADEADSTESATPAPPAAPTAPVAPAAPQPTLHASAVLKSTAEHQVTGTVHFEQIGDEVTITADLTGVPSGEHGFHIHETGICEEPGFESAGTHFNPSNQPHGAPSNGAHHAGDLGNLLATAGGTAQVRMSSSAISLREGESSILGRAVILHQGPDQFAVQPDGDAGARIACGVVQLAPTS